MSWIESKIEEISAAVTAEGQRTRLEVAAGLASTVRGLRLDGANPRPLRAGSVYAGARRVVGWSVRETGGTGPVAVDLYDGADAGAVEDGRLVASFTVAAGGTCVHSFPAGISVTEGLFAVLTGAGAARGVVLIGAVD